jgi:hypothetical protein
MREVIRKVEHLAPDVIPVFITGETGMAGVVTSGQRAREKGPGTRVRTKIDYTLPLGEEESFEVGYQSRISRSEDIIEFYEYDPVSGDYELTPGILTGRLGLAAAGRDRSRPAMFCVRCKTAPVVAGVII